MHGYVPIDRGLLDSTLWTHGDSDTVRLWIYLLMIADIHTGLVDIPIPTLAARNNLAVERVEEILNIFSSPDKYSRTQKFDGRRIELTDDGIIILNYEKYRPKNYNSTNRVRRFYEKNPTLSHRVNGGTLGNAGERGGTRGNAGGTKETKKEKELKKENKTKEKSSLSESDDVRRVFDFWVKTFWSGRGREPKLDQKRRGKIKARLKEGFSVEQLTGAIAGASKSDFHVTNGYTGLATILRDTETVEGHFARLRPCSEAGHKPTPEVLEARRILTTSTDTAIANMKENGDYEKYRKTIEDWEAKHESK